MSSTTKSSIIDILTEISECKLGHTRDVTPLPFVCVSYAQSLDGCVAVASRASESLSSNLQLSCDDSFLLTHALRSIHDGILIGGNTLLTDNPRLNNRLWNDSVANKLSQEETYENYKQPIPIILDTDLRHLNKLIETNDELNIFSCHKHIIVCCSKDAKQRLHQQVNTYCSSRNVMISLISCIKSDVTQVLDLESTLKVLKSECGISSIMVEGGASILSAFLSQDGIKFVNSICVTICPKLLGGKTGVGALAKSSFGISIREGVEDERNDKTSGRIFDLTEHGKSKFYVLGCDSILLSIISHQ